MTAEADDGSRAPAGPEGDPTRCGFVAVIGAPNVGKSTLVNRLVGTKVSIVSPKVQTTRSRVLGIVLSGPAQIVLVDTPGIFTPRRRLDRAMVAAAWGGAAEADRVLLLIDAAKGFDPPSRAIVQDLRPRARPPLLALNKVDQVAKPDLLALAAAVNQAGPFERTFMISALTGDGVADLLRFLAADVPAGPWLFPEDQVSDMPLRLLAAEITREQLYLQTHQELPYASAVTTEAWRENPDGSVRVDQVIFVERESQKAMVVGKGGQRIRRIGEAARMELAALLERPVHLFLFVKVRERWEDDPERYRDLGLDFPR